MSAIECKKDQIKQDKIANSCSCSYGIKSNLKKFKFKVARYKIK